MLSSRKVLIPIVLLGVAFLGACNEASMPSGPEVEMRAPATEPDGLTSLALGSQRNGRGDGPIVYVTSQGLFFDSIVTADPLPFRGRFQKLEAGGPSGLQTEFGPGDQEYVGGRWWMDVNGNGEMDPDDHYFSCPLLGPGRDTP